MGARNNVPHLEELGRVLAVVPTGPIPEADSARIAALLMSAWHDLPGGAAAGMAADKLQRAENLRWEPPYLAFTIARHGGTVQGSSRETLHEWRVDVAQGSATLTSTRRFRQVVPRAPTVDVASVVERIVQAIDLQQAHPAVDLLAPTRVRVVATRVAELGLRSAVQQTAASRRKRFRERLTQQLQLHGWVPTGTSARMEFERDPHRQSGDVATPAE